MFSAKVFPVFALVCLLVVFFEQCHGQQFDMDPAIRDACTSEFNAASFDWKDEKAEDLPENIQCCIKCIITKMAAKNNVDVKTAYKTLSPENQAVFEKCAGDMKDDSCLTFASLMSCIRSGFKA